MVLGCYKLQLRHVCLGPAVEVVGTLAYAGSPFRHAENVQVNPLRLLESMGDITVTILVTISFRD